MGKGKGKQKEPYVVCKNASCNPKRTDGGLSWRKVSHGPDNCVHCGTPFRLPVWAATPESSWYVRNGKGRLRPQPGHTANGAGADKDKKKEKPDDDAALAEALRKKCEGDEQKLQVVEQAILLACPPKPKSHDELFREGTSNLEVAQARRHHLSKVVLDMDAKHKKMCVALMEHKKSMESHAEQLQEAEVEVQKAQQSLLHLQALQPPARQEPAVATSTAARTFVEALQMPRLPNMEISRAILEVPSVNSMPAHESASLQRSMAAILDQYVQTLNAAMLTAAGAAAKVAFPEHPPLPPPSSFPPAVPLIFDGCPTFQTVSEDAAIPGRVDDVVGGTATAAASDHRWGSAEDGIEDFDFEEEDAGMQEGREHQIKRESQQDASESKARRTRLQDKQIASLPQSQQHSPEELQAIVANAQTEAKKVADLQVLADTAAAAAAGAAPGGGGSHG